MQPILHGFRKRALARKCNRCQSFLPAMKRRLFPTLLITLTVFGFAFSAVAQDAKILCFEKKSGDSEEQLYLVIEGYMVRGTRASASEAASAYGKIFGNVREKDGILHVTYHYEIDGDQPGSEEQLMKLGKGSIALADGELEEHGPGQLVLKNPKAAKFTKVFKQVPLRDVEAGSPEAKAIVKAVDGVLSDSVGFSPGYENGFFRLAGDWALFQGFLTLPDGKKAAHPALAAQFAEREFQAQLRKDGKGMWKVIRHGFALPDGSFDYTHLNDAPAPWQLAESMKNRG